jgi:Family of unknown function (DUF5681)
MPRASETGSKVPAPKRRGPGHKWVKGQSGNPRGRKEKTVEEIDLIAACRAKTPQALDVMVRIMEHGENERNQLTAAQGIIERAYGKPVQPTEVDLNGKLLIAEVRRRIIDELGE